MLPLQNNQFTEHNYLELLTTDYAINNWFNNCAFSAFIQCISHLGVAWLKSGRGTKYRIWTFGGGGETKNFRILFGSFGHKNSNYGHAYRKSLKDRFMAQTFKIDRFFFARHWRYYEISAPIGGPLAGVGVESPWSPPAYADVMNKCEQYHGRSQPSA